MNRLLERLDRHMTVLVPLLYLVGLIAGTASYFTGVHIGALFAVGLALSGAAEIHSFLEQRRVRLTGALLLKLAPEDSRRAQLVTQLRVHLALLVGLICFSIGNGIAFWAQQDHPATAGDWAQVITRGLVIPLLFLATGALAPISSDAAALLSQAADDMLYATVKASVKQWKRRIKLARKAGRDLAPIAVTLMLDAGETDGARRIQLIAEGLAAVEAGAPLGRPQPTPPTNGGTPIPFGPRRADLQALPQIGAGWPDALIQPEQNIQNAPPTLPAPVSQPMSPEEIRVRKALADEPGLSVDGIVARTGVAKSTASKVKRIVAEAHAQRQQLAQ